MYDTLSSVTCHKCNITFGVPSEWNERRRQAKDEFYCPLGHALAYSGQNDKEKLALKESEIQKLRADLYAAQDDRDRAKKKLTQVSKRIHAGVCPKCNRTFENVARHMKSKHS